MIIMKPVGCFHKIYLVELSLFRDLSFFYRNVISSDTFNINLVSYRDISSQRRLLVDRHLIPCYFELI